MGSYRDKKEVVSVFVRFRAPLQSLDRWRLAVVSGSVKETCKAGRAGQRPS
jgi:hypothetical protein